MRHTHFLIKLLLLSTSLAVISPSFAVDKPKWTHSDASSWSQLDENYRLCEAGKSQSPINIVTKDTVKATLPKIETSYQTAGYRVLDNWNMIQVTAPKEPAGVLRFKDTDYRLVMIHFHTPAETAINGKHAPMGIHLIHQSPEKQRAIIMVNVMLGKPNPTVQKILDNLPEKQGEETTLAMAFDPNALLPKEQGYFYYTGSITIPPCLEGAQWIVMKKAITMSEKQMNEFAKRYQNNVRPLQPLNGRIVEQTINKRY